MTRPADERASLQAALEDADFAFEVAAQNLAFECDRFADSALTIEAFRDRTARTRAAYREATEVRAQARRALIAHLTGTPVEVVPHVAAVTLPPWHEAEIERRRAARAREEYTDAMVSAAKEDRDDEDLDR